jgi:hypothetical protein
LPRLERTVEARGTVPGPTPPASVEAAAAFETLAQLLVEAAPREMIVRRLGQAVAQTSRQVRALERRVEPALAAAVSTLTGLARRARARGASAAAVLPEEAPARLTRRRGAAKS